MVSLDVSSFTFLFERYGIMEFLLPFILIFTIVFAILQKSQILGTDKKNFNVVVALVLGLLFVIPHFTGDYPLGYDPVQVINDSLPSISLVAVAAIMLLLLMGIFGARFAATFSPIIAVAAIAFVVYIFGASLHFWDDPSTTFSWWTDQTTELLIVILIFGLVIWFITKEPGEGKIFGKIGDWLKSITEQINK
jgi:amino acid transporter